MATITRKIRNNKSRNEKHVVKFTDLAGQDLTRLQKLVDAGTISREALAHMDSVDMSKCERPISVLQLNYNPVNNIGPATTAMTNFITINVHKDMESFKRMLVDLKEKDKHVEWKTIWKPGYNMFKEFNLITGQSYTIFVVTNAEIKQFMKQVQQLSASKLSEAEAIQMQYDFRPILRAFQESAIDVVKDKKKRFDYDYTQIINSVTVKSTFIKKHREHIDFNFNAVKAAKRAGKEMPKFQFSLEFEKNNEILKYEDQATDSISQINDTTIKAVERFLNGDILRVYATSDDTDMLARFIDAAAEHKELALFIKQVYKMLNNAIFNENITIDKKNDYPMLRNAIYSKATELQVEASDVITVALSVAMSNVFQRANGEIVVEPNPERFSDVHVKNIFPEEFVCAIANIVPQAELLLDEICMATRGIEDGETIEFVNGKSTDGCFEVVDNEFTAIVTEEDGCLVYDLDIYNYEYVETVMIDKTFQANTTVKALKEANETKTTNKLQDKGQALNHSVTENAVTHILIGGSNNNIIVNSTTKHVLGLTSVPTETKGNKTVDRIMSYEAKNDHQQLFLVIFE